MVLGSTRGINPGARSLVSQSGGDEIGSLLYPSQFSFIGSRPFPVLYIKDRMVLLGEKQNSSGLGADMSLRAFGHFPCGTAGNGELTKVVITVEDGLQHPGIAVQLSGNTGSFDTFPLFDQADFIKKFCRFGEKKVTRNYPVGFDVEKTCRVDGGVEATRVDSFSTDVSVICDLLPNADPANYDKHKTWYNFGFMDKMMSVSGEPGVLQVV